jgi:subtilisin family serine protease
MKRLFIINVLLASATMSVMAQTSKMTLDARMQVENRQATSQTKTAAATSVDVLNAIIKLDETCIDKTLDALREAGVKLQGCLGQQVAAAIPLDRLQQVEDIPGVLRIGTGGPAPKMLTDVSRGEIGVSDIDGTRGTVGSQPYSGRGITIAVLDGGFDFQHPAFKDSEGRSRIKAFYSPFDESGKKVVADGMELPGSLFDTPEQIAALTTDFPTGEHGSHTASIAAGTRSPQGFGGMAPDADIVLCSVYASDASEESMTLDKIISSSSTFYDLVFLKEYAKQLNQPIVVSMSLGTNNGSHNGKGEITEAVEAICQEGVPLVISAGNEGDRRLFLHKDFESDTDTLRTMIALKERVENIEGFAPKDAELCMRLSLVRKDGDNQWTTLWQSPMVNTETGILPDINSESQPSLAEGFNGILRLGVSRETDQVHMRICGMGMLEEGYFLDLTVGSKQGVALDIFNGELTSENREGYSNSVNSMSLNDWATAPSCISVGAYTANTTVRSLYIEPMVSTEDPLNDIADLSSYGTSLNGVHVPTICAPGIHVVAAVNHYNVETDVNDNPKPYRSEMTWQGFPYNSESGTSMAAPTVAGTIALWLEANPKLTPAELKDFIICSARTDSFTEAKPDQFGNGKIDAKRGLELILQGTAIRDISEEYQNETGTIYYDLQGRSYSKPHANGIYINSGKKIIIK